MPNVVVIAGPNGAGKSTVAPAFLGQYLGIGEFVNADVIARGLSGFDPERAAIQAGRVMLARLCELAEARQNFAFETTLASRTFAPWIAGLVGSGYTFHLAFVWVSSPDLSIARVARRVNAGGHHVDAEVVRRRYFAGLRNFFTLYRPLARPWQVYDNSAEGSLRLVAEGNGIESPLVHDARTWERLREWATDECHRPN